MASSRQSFHVGRLHASGDSECRYKETALARVRSLFEEDWRRISIVALDEVTCSLAADIAEMTGVRTLDALHLGAASRLGPRTVRLLTFDIRQAQAARHLGFEVLGV